MRVAARPGEGTERRKLCSAAARWSPLGDQQTSAVGAAPVGFWLAHEADYSCGHLHVHNKHCCSAFTTVHCSLFCGGRWLLPGRVALARWRCGRHLPPAGGAVGAGYDTGSSLPCALALHAFCCAELMCRLWDGIVITWRCPTLRLVVLWRYWQDRVNFCAVMPRPWHSGEDCAH